MSNFPKCDLKTGLWAPPGLAGSLQAQGVVAVEKNKDQLAGGSFSEVELQSIRGAVRKKYMIVSGSAEGMFRYPTGRDGAVHLGYDPFLIDDIPAELLNAFCGVGNPFAIAAVAPGSAVLDIGCGAGFDLIVARRTVGDDGRVCGMDMTPEMLTRARKNFAELMISDIETVLVESESIPYDDNTFDVVISNGVINLSPRKGELFLEIHRVLRPGGRLQFADIVLDRDLPPALAGNLDAWAQWIGGAVSVRDQITLMEKAGFIAVRYFGATDIRTSDYTVGALFVAEAGK